MTAPSPLYLVIDQGGHASRAFVFDVQGRELSRGTSPIEAEETATGGVEYDADALLASIRKAIDEAVTAPNVTLTSIIAAGLATQRSNVACWDRFTGEALSPLISWQDRRAAEWIKQFSDNTELLHQHTGLFPSPHYGISKLQWCYENLPQVREAHLQQRLCWGPMSSYLLYQLLDEHPYFVDHVNASRTLLWNIETQNWDSTLQKLFGFADNPLPQTVPNHYPFGTLIIDNHPIPMTTMIGDQSASLFSWQQLQHDALYINIGTGAFVQRVTGNRCVITPHQLTSLLLHQGENPHFALEGTINGAGSALRWLEQQAPVEDLYQKLPAWLSQRDQPLLFLNGISGLGSPYWQAEFSPHFIGDGGIKEKYCALIESIAFLLQVNIDELQHHQPGAEKILISGGVAQLDGLCQRIADLSGLKITRMDESEATATGLAWILVHQESAAQDPRWHQPDLQYFTPVNNAPLAERYLRWQSAMDRSLQQHKQ